MTRTTVIATGRAPVRAVLAALLSFSSLSLQADGLPPNLVFFFPGTECPKGSVAAANVGGRMLLAVSNPADVGQTYGTALANQEDRRHQHAGTMRVELPTKAIAGASGCCNDQATSASSHATAMTSGEVASGLPFIQLLVCQAQ